MTVKMENICLTMSEVATLTLIYEKKGKPLPAWRIASSIPSPKKERRGLTVREARNVISSLSDKEIIQKNRRKDEYGGDLASSYFISPPEGPYKGTDINNPNMYNFFKALNGWGGEMKLWDLAQKVDMRTKMPATRVFRALLWIAKKMGVSLEDVFDAGAERIKGRIPFIDALRREIKNRGVYFLTTLETELNSTPPHLRSKWKSRIRDDPDKYIRGKYGHLVQR